MRKRIWALFCSCFLLFTYGCEKEEKPLLPPEKLVEMLVDAHLIEAALLGFSDLQKDSLTAIYYQQIYEIHEVSKDSFEAEMNYLKSHPDYFGEIYEKVLEEISKREAELK